MRPVFRLLRSPNILPRRPVRCSLVRSPRARRFTTVQDELRKRTKYYFTQVPGEGQKQWPAKIVKFLIYYTIAKWTFDILVSTFFVDKPRKEDKESSAGKDEDESEEGEEEEFDIEIPDETPADGHFVALGLPREIERDANERAYLLNDPDYKNIAALEADQKGQKDMKLHIMRQGLETLNQTRELQVAIGRPIRCTAAWIDIWPETKIPTEYQRLGLEYNPGKPTDPGAIYPVRRSLNAQEATKLWNIIYPISLIDASSTFFKTLYDLKMKKWQDASAESSSFWKFKKSDNTNSGTPNKLPGDLNVDIDRAATASAVKSVQGNKGTSVPNVTDVTKIALPGSPTSNSTPASPSRPAPKAPEPSTPPKSEGGVLDALRSIGPFYHQDTARKHIVSPWSKGSDFSKAANKALAQLMNHATASDFAMVRGDVLVKGLLEYKGPRGRIHLKVLGYINARTRETRLTWEPEIIASSRPLPGRKQKPGK